MLLFYCPVLAPGHYRPENYNPDHVPAFTFGVKTAIMPGKYNLSYYLFPLLN